MIPPSVTNIGLTAFNNCRSLTAITVNPTNSFYSSMNGVLFNKSLTSLIQFPAGLGGSYAIPNSVTDVWTLAFDSSTRLTNVTIPASVTTLGDEVFQYCTSLMAITVATNNPDYCSVDGVLFDKGLTTLIQFPGGVGGDYTVPAGVVNIGSYAFAYAHLNSVTLPASVAGAGDYAFVFAGLAAVYFEGNAPGPDFGASAFDYDNATVYYLPGTTGWDTNYAGLATAPWYLPNPVILNNTAGFGLQTNGFGFTVSWATNAAVVVEACSDLANPNWSPVGTNILSSTLLK